MTFEEVLKLANEGNEAAIQVAGDACWEKKDISNAIKYHEMAAELGYAASIQKAMLMRSIMASASISLRDYEGTVHNCERQFYWARYMLAIKNTAHPEQYTAEEYARAEHYANDALYIGATAYYYLKDFQNALEASEGLQTIKIQLIHACTLFQLGNADQKAFVELQIMERSNFYQEGEFAGDVDDALVSQAAQSLALIYRTGIAGCKENIRAAHDVLERAAAVIKTAAPKKRVIDELAHYRKGVLGVYRYQ